MQNSLHAPFAIVALLWATYLSQLYRTYRTHKLKSPLVRLIWLAGFLGVLVITFSGRQMEQVVQGVVGDLPVLFYTKFVCALLIIHILYLMFRHTMPIPRTKDRVFLGMSLAAIMMGLLTAPLFIRLVPTAREQLRYGLLALRDVVVCTYMLVIFIPATYALWQNETIRPTQLKHFAGLLFDVSYLLLGLGNLLTFLASFSSLETAAFVDAAFRPVMALCTLFFTIAIASSRTLVAVLWSHQRFMLWRLRCLERRIIRLVGEAESSPAGLGIEDRIYRTVISILDHYPQLRDQADTRLYERIDSIISTQRDYPRLIEALAKLV